jgi:hypothetical protein
LLSSDPTLIAATGTTPITALCAELVLLGIWPVLFVVCGVDLHILQQSIEMYASDERQQRASVRQLSPLDPARCTFELVAPGC